jgi:hypothetical protein
MRRYDVAELRGVERTPQGGLRIQANLTRTGVFKYRQHDGTMRRELRHPDDVFAGSSLSTFRQAPVTNLHPAVGPVTPENWKTLAVGTVADDVRQDGAFVAASLAVQDADMIRLIEAGERKEISCGYDCDVVDEAGIYEGEAYDCRQTNIVGNHVALGPTNWGRAGRDVKLRLDADDAEQVLENKDMKTTKIDGVDYEVGSDAHLAKIDSIHAKALELEKTASAKLVEAEKVRADAATAALATEKTRADNATADLAAATDPKALHKRVVERLRIVDSFRKASRIVLDREPDEAKRKARADADEKKAEGSSDNELMASVVKMIAPEFDSTDESEIRGAFKLVIAKLMAGGGEPDGDETQDATAIETPSDGGDPTMQPGQGGSREGEGMDGAPPRSPVAPPRRDSIYDARGGRGDGVAPKLSAEEKNRQDSVDAWKKPLRHTRDAR